MSIAEIQTIDDLISQLVADFRSCDLKYCGLTGRWHHVTVPVSERGIELLREGVGFDGSSIPGFARLEHGDMLLRPDPSTAFVDPFCDEPTLSVICDCILCDTRQPFERDPRYIASKAENYLESFGVADESFWLPELEFHLVSAVSFYDECYGSGYSIRSMESRRVLSTLDEEGGEIGLGPKAGYHALPPQDQLLDVRMRMVRAIENAGIDVKYHHHEVGADGQLEIELFYNTLRRTADSILLSKYIIRNVARQAGLVAVFLPKPFFGEAGNGMHFHQYLRKDNKPVFYKEGNYANLSDVALHYLGGILKHGRSLLAFTDPSTNSYRRLVPGYEAPTNLFFSSGNRSAAIRIPLYADTPETKCMEFRPGDATANPYFAMAAMLMAGLDGIKHKIDPGEEGFGPFDTNITEMPAEVLAKIVPVPKSLDEALEALKADHSYLLEGGVFSNDVLDAWISTKLDNDVKAVARRPHPYEVALYFDL
ncbi:MAG: type I glutamate--ammonia ligase [Candidatus Coatesbacteria bacterium]|nr:MAG: type I glutamate--ammonia ligase [Candidatus Coatesbacteria bacterium]